MKTRGYGILVALLAAAVAFGLPAIAGATSIQVGQADWIGSRSTADNSLHAQDGWNGDGNNGFQISWNISLDFNTGVYTYKYSISGEGGKALSKGLSHWILEVTNQSVSSDFFETQTFEGPKHYFKSGSNPDMPDVGIYGIKWDVAGNGDTFNITFKTYKDPVWGDFYAKDGKQDGIWAVAYNLGFGTDPTSSTIDFKYWIPTPNSGTTVVPLPSSALLVGSGLLGLVLVGRRLRQRR